MELLSGMQVLQSGGSNVVVIKLGGSALTDKSRGSGGVRAEVLENVASDLRYLRSRGFSVVLVTGGGYEAHKLAKEYGLGCKYVDSSRFSGAILTHIAAANLCEYVCKYLCERGIAASPLHPFSMTVLCGCNVEYFPIDVVEQLLVKGVVPVLHGDVCLDREYNFSILSGDDIVKYLCNVLLGVRCCIFLMDVPGILRDSGDEIYSTIYVSELDSVVHEVMSRGGTDKTTVVDVTGGIRKKLYVARDIARRGIPVYFASGFRKGVLRLIVDGLGTAGKDFTVVIPQ
ncbi:MAG: hypothetical protein DRJ40_10690 [Thermoprotei archaeon]|nr:MAG: hypothetical protein DRJ40_10690 [Thermoprotei archaeon]